MPIANYTTTVAATRSVMLVQEMLADAGAKAIMFEYDCGEASAVTFRVDRGDAQMGFKLPCDWRKTLAILNKTKEVPRSRKTPEHAKRVAWRCVHDWLRAQLALIEIGAAELQQVMLPYSITNNGQTLYERLGESGLKQIGW